MSLRCLDQDEYVHHGHTSSRHLQEVLQKRLQTSKHFLVSKTSWRGLKDVFSVIIFQLPGRLQDVRKTKNCYAESILKKYFSELVILRSWVILRSSISELSWGRLPDFLETTKCFLEKNLYLFLTNLNLYLTNLHLINLRRIQEKSKMY